MDLNRATDSASLISSDRHARGSQAVSWLVGRYNIRDIGWG
jgi:hypothetical protein